MAKIEDMRGFMRELKRRGKLVRVKRPVATKFELAAILKKVQDTTGCAVLFEKVDGKSACVGNLYGGRDKFGVLLEVEPEEVTEKFMELSSRKPLSPVSVKGKSPSQERVYKRFQDISEIVSIPFHYAKDAAPLLAAAMVVCQDPETKKYNLSINRMQLRSDKRLGIQLVINMDIWNIQRRCEERGKALPLAILVGPDPYTYLAACARVPPGMDEYEFAGALKGEPIKLIDCLSVPLKIPATAEMVLEGVIPPGAREPEGPMGEVLQYYGAVSDKHVVDIKLITTRDRPIFQTILSGSIEEHTLLGIPLEAELLPILRKVSPLVKSINLLPFFLNCSISVGDIPDTMRGLGKNIILAALSHPWLKCVVVVNDDVDIYSPSDLFWALATRVNFDKDLVLVKDTHGFPLDEMKTDRKETITRIGIDATVEPYHRSRFERRNVVGYDKIDLKDYLGA